jgi:hypothetical protein
MITENMSLLCVGELLMTCPERGVRRDESLNR